MANPGALTPTFFVNGYLPFNRLDFWLVVSL